MKILHLSDLHIGLRLMNRDLSEDQKYILNQLVRLAAAASPDAIVIAGDIYDRAVPSAEAVEIFDDFVSDLVESLPGTEIMMISGNHDSSSRIDIFRRVLSRQRIHMIGMPPRLPEEHIEKVTLEDEYGKVNFYLLPFVKPSMVRLITGVQENGNNLSYNDALHRLIEREEIDREQRNVLVSHQFYLPAGKRPEEIERMESEICTVGNIDEVGADILELFDYAALGHIHKPMKVGSENYRYCGTPLACSVSEAGQQKGILEITLEEKGSCTVRVLPLKPLRQVRIVRGDLNEALEQASDDYVRVELTDEADLDVMDMQDRLHHAFPNLLEIRRLVCSHRAEKEEYLQEQETDPFVLCCGFVEKMDELDQALLKDVINTVGSTL